MKKIFVFLFAVASIDAASNGSKVNHDYQTDQEMNSLEDLYHDDVLDSDVLRDPLREMDRDEDKFFDDLESLHKPAVPAKPKPTTPNPQKK